MIIEIKINYLGKFTSIEHIPKVPFTICTALHFTKTLSAKYVIYNNGLDLIFHGLEVIWKFILFKRSNLFN
jgi:hypothetical protein